jgi:hypothetical protein
MSAKAGSEFCFVGQPLPDHLANPPGGMPYSPATASLPKLEKEGMNLSFYLSSQIFYLYYLYDSNTPPLKKNSPYPQGC